MRRSLPKALSGELRDFLAGSLCSPVGSFGPPRSAAAVALSAGVADTSFIAV
jgi:hypothetical protein